MSIPQRRSHPTRIRPGRASGVRPTSGVGFYPLQIANHMKNVMSQKRFSARRGCSMRRVKKESHESEWHRKVRYLPRRVISPSFASHGCECRSPSIMWCTSHCCAPARICGHAGWTARWLSDDDRQPTRSYGTPVYVGSSLYRAITTGAAQHRAGRAIRC
jgi:hypothetical protein